MDNVSKAKYNDGDEDTVSFVITIPGDLYEILYNEAPRLGLSVHDYLIKLANDAVNE